MATPAEHAHGVHKYRPTGGSQNAQGCDSDQGALHRLPSFWISSRTSSSVIPTSARPSLIVSRTRPARRTPACRAVQQNPSPHRRRGGDHYPQGPLDVDARECASDRRDLSRVRGVCLVGRLCARRHVSFPKIPSARIGAMRENRRIIHYDACPAPPVRSSCRKPVQVATSA